MSDWKHYLNDRLIRHYDGFVVIKPIDAPPNIPICCPLCDCVMRTRDDEQSFNDFECCYYCAMTWAHPRRQAWKNGWRPSKEQVDKMLLDRPLINLTLVIE